MKVILYLIGVGIVAFGAQYIMDTRHAQVERDHLAAEYDYGTSE